MTSKLFLLSSLLLASVVSLHAAFWTIGSGAVDTVARNMLAAMANGAALGETALQPAATNTLAAAAAHAATEHSVTEDGGFQAGFGASATTGGAVGYSASATEGGGAVGYSASATWGGGAVGDSASAASGGGAVGFYASATYGGAVGYSASATEGGGAVGYYASAASGGGAVGYYASAASGGGAVGFYASAADGGAVGYSARTSDGFAGGKYAFATSDGDFFGNPIDAIQLGSGGNSTPMTLQIYDNRLLNADGTIPIERMSLHDGDETAHADIRALIPTLPGPGCTELGYAADGTNVAITGATYSYFFAPDKAYTLSVAPDAPRYHYSIEIIGDHACTLPADHRLRGEWTITGTNEVVVAPSTGIVWNVFGRGL